MEGDFHLAPWCLLGDRLSACATVAAPAYHPFFCGLLPRARARARARLHKSIIHTVVHPFSTRERRERTRGNSPSPTCLQLPTSPRLELRQLLRGGGSGSKAAAVPPMTMPMVVPCRVVVVAAAVVHYTLPPHQHLAAQCPCIYEKVCVVAYTRYATVLYATSKKAY